ncbi:MAG: hypothetical protein PHV06_06455 [bacterium]|nr:hypothetical protein [bacterium]
MFNRVKRVIKNIFEKGDQDIIPGLFEDPDYLCVRFQIEYHTCNLACPYCIARCPEKENIFDMDSFKSIIEKLNTWNRKIVLRIGVQGELFTSPEIMTEVSRICNQENNFIGINFSSNLVADWDRVIEPFITRTNLKKLGMGCTLHDTVIKDTDMFFKKVEKLKKLGVLIYVGYVAFPDRIDKMKEYKKICDGMNVPLIFNALIGKYNEKHYPRDYTLEEKKELRKIWFTPHSFMVLVKSIDTFGMDCTAGHKFIYINSKGDIFPCHDIHKFMGNILNDKITLNPEPMKCEVHKCFCGNQNQALCIVDRYYNRTRNPRIFFPKENFKRSDLFKGYKP